MVTCFQQDQYFSWSKSERTRDCVFFQRYNISMYIQPRWCIYPFSICSLLWCSTTNLYWKLFKDKNVGSQPPLSSMTHLFSTLTYQNITTFKYFSKRFQLENLLNIFFSAMTWSAYDISIDYAIMSLGIFIVQWVTHITACQFRWAIVKNCFHYMIAVSWLLFYCALG